MQTIEEIKDEIIEFYFYATTVEGKFYEDNFIEKLDKLIETVATLQREKCAKEACLEPNGMLLQIDKESILNAKL